MSKEKKNTASFVEPTKSELEILQVLWELGPSSVRTVNEQLNEHNREVNYLSTLKLMQIMVEKGILQRDESSMKHIYIPVLGEQKTKAFLLDRFIDTLYKGSTSNLLMQMFGNRKPTQKELDTVKELLAKLEKNK